MFLSILKKNNIYIFWLLVVLTSCSSRFCPYEEAIEIPCDWHTPLKGGITVENPACFLWWTALEDPLLTAFIEQSAYTNKDVRLAAAQSKEKMLEAVNAAAAEIAKNYIELRGLQNRLIVLQANIEAQNQILSLNEGLSTKGFFSVIEQNDNKKSLDTLLMQRSIIGFSVDKTIFHLSTLLGDPAEKLYDTLSLPQKLPELPCDIPIGLPVELMRRNPTIQEAKKAYDKSKNKQAFYNYQKTILSVLEEAETALAAFLFELDKNYYLGDIKSLKADSYYLTKDLYNQGLKDERDVLRAQQEYLMEESAFIQSQADLLNHYVNLYQVLGRGWEMECYNQ